MNPALILEGLQALEAALAAGPQLYADFQALKMAGTVSAADLAALEAKIATIDAARLASWAQADAALDEAAKS